VNKNSRGRFWVDISLASFSGLLLLMTAVLPDWLELAAGWDPDRHDGSVERVIVGGGLLLATVLLGGRAVMEWRRAAAEPSP
jgi:hypothetical protein